jgi:hypothetical protein
LPGLAAYLTLGWVGVFTGAVLAHRCRLSFIGPLAWGGVADTAGAVREFLRWPPLLVGVVGPHELFHGLVRRGAGCQWRFGFRFASGRLPAPHRRVARGRPSNSERKPMDTMTLVVSVGAVLVLAAVGGYGLVRWRGERRRAAEAVFYHFRCPGCQRRLRFQARQAGHKGQCSHCGQGVTFPATSQSID